MEANVEYTAGFARAVQNVSSGDGWDHIYGMSYLYGFFTSLTMHWLLHMTFPTERQRGSSPFVLEDHAEMLDNSGSGPGTPATLDDGEKAVTVPKM